MARLLESTLRSTYNYKVWRGGIYNFSPKTQVNTELIIAEKIRKAVEMYNFKNQTAQPNYFF